MFVCILRGLSYVTQLISTLFFGPGVNSWDTQLSKFSLQVVESGNTAKSKLNFRGSLRRTEMGSLQKISGQMFRVNFRRNSAIMCCELSCNYWGTAVSITCFVMHPFMVYSEGVLLKNSDRNCNRVALWLTTFRYWTKPLSSGHHSDLPGGLHFVPRNLQRN